MPTVNWSRADAATNSSLPSVVMQALVAAATAQGWTVDYADTNAIGTGSSGNPKFDTVAYSSAASVGIMILKMPAGAFSTRWLVKVEALWGTSTGAWQIKLTTATAQTGGALTDPGTTIIMGSVSTNVSNLEYWVGAHINEVVISLPQYWAVVIGRKRTLGGQTLDDNGVLALGGGTGYTTGFPAPINTAQPVGGLCLVRNVSQGEYTAAYALNWGSATGTAIYNGPVTLTDASGSYGYPVGPFWMGNGPGGFPRLLGVFPTGDLPAALNNLTVTVDGADRLFFVPSGYGPALNGCRWAFAKE